LADLRGLKMAFKFEFETPFRPFEQLMGVLPFASREYIPMAYQVGSHSSTHENHSDARVAVGLGVRPELRYPGLLPYRI
jgi:Xrn1 helical domain